MSAFIVRSEQSELGWNKNKTVHIGWETMDRKKGTPQIKIGKGATKEEDIPSTSTYILLDTFLLCKILNKF